MTLRRFFHWYPTCIASLWLLAELLSAGGLIGGNIYEPMIALAGVFGFPVLFVLMFAIWATPMFAIVGSLIVICPMIWGLVWITREPGKGRWAPVPYVSPPLLIVISAFTFFAHERMDHARNDREATAREQKIRAELSEMAARATPNDVESWGAAIVLSSLEAKGSFHGTDGPDEDAHLLIRRLHAAGALPFVRSVVALLYRDDPYVAIRVAESLSPITNASAEQHAMVAGALMVFANNDVDNKDNDALRVYAALCRAGWRMKSVAQFDFPGSLHDPPYFLKPGQLVSEKVIHFGAPRTLEAAAWNKDYVDPNATPTDLWLERFRRGCPEETRSSGPGKGDSRLANDGQAIYGVDMATGFSRAPTVYAGRIFAMSNAGALWAVDIDAPGATAGSEKLAGGLW